MKKLLMSNFKSNKSVEESNEWITTVISEVSWGSLGHFEIGVAPAFPAIESFSTAINKSNGLLKLAIQDLSAYPAGSYTGAVSTRNVADLHVSYAILGHSERRRYFNEGSELVAKKVTQAVENNITPLLCIDEPYFEEQLSFLDESVIKKTIFVYEPLSAIGTGNNVSVKVVADMRKKVEQLCGTCMFMYGGSVTDLNVSEFLIVTDGVLVGSFSLKAQDFVKLVSTATAV